MTTTYVYDALGRLAAEYSSQTPAGTGGTFFRTQDHLGSTIMVTKADKSIALCRDFFPFGEQIPASSTYSSRDQAACYGGSTNAFSQQFTGQQRDDESKLDYFGARYYRPLLGRFTSPDAPLVDQFAGNPQSWNLYSYVRNNPLRYIDPTGQVIQLLGKTEEERQAELEAIRASLVDSEVADRLSITTNNEGQFVIGIEGNIVEFQKAGDLEAVLGAQVASDTVVEFGLNDATSTKSEGFFDSFIGNNSDVGVRFGGGVTHRSDATLSGNIQVIIDPNDIRHVHTEAPRPTLGEAVAHELLGHAVGFMISPRAPANTTNRRAVDAENKARRRGLNRGKRESHRGGFP